MSENPPFPDEDKRGTMLMGEGFIQGTEPYDRWNTQEFVARTQ
jgi:hypothetical protein